MNIKFTFCLTRQLDDRIILELDQYFWLILYFYVWVETTKKWNEVEWFFNLYLWRNYPYIVYFYLKYLWIYSFKLFESHIYPIFIFLCLSIYFFRCLYIHISISFQNIYVSPYYYTSKYYIRAYVNVNICGGI